jgi:hypothetical protein
MTLGRVCRLNVLNTPFNLPLRILASDNVVFPHTMANRIETMDWERLPKRVFYSILVVDAQSAEPARKKGGCSNFKANLWVDLTRFKLASDVV